LQFQGKSAKATAIDILNNVFTIKKKYDITFLVKKKE